MSLASLFRSKVNVVRTTKTAGALGGWTEVENVLHLNLKCRINWKRGSEKIFFGKDAYFRDGKLFCRIVDVTTKDKVIYNGVAYNIVDVNNTDEVGKFLVLDLKLVE